MSPLAISLVAFACIFGGTVLGMFLRTILPEHHLSDESNDAVKLGIGMVATLAALVLGLLTASAKGTFDTASTGLRQASTRVILLDRVIAHYGPETMEARELLRRHVTSVIERIWPEYKIGPAGAEAPTGRVDIEAVQDRLRQLSPRTDAQRWLQARALQISGDIAEERWVLIEQMVQEITPDGVLGDHGLLAHNHLRHLWPVLSSQRHGNSCLVRLRLIGRGLAISDPRQVVPGPPQ